MNLLMLLFFFVVYYIFVILGGHTCPTCGKIYDYKGTLSRHMRIECGQEKNFICPICSHKFYYNSDLRKHLNNKHGALLKTSTNVWSTINVIT